MVLQLILGFIMIVSFVKMCVAARRQTRQINSMNWEPGLKSISLYTYMAYVLIFFVTA